MGTQKHLWSSDYPWNCSGPNQPCETQEDTWVRLAALTAHTEDANRKTTSSLKLSQDLAPLHVSLPTLTLFPQNFLGQGRGLILALLWSSRIVPGKAKQ